MHPKNLFDYSKLQFMKFLVTIMIMTMGVIFTVLIDTDESFNNTALKHDPFVPLGCSRTRL